MTAPAHPILREVVLVNYYGRAEVAGFLAGIDRDVPSSSSTTAKAVTTSTSCWPTG